MDADQGLSDEGIADVKRIADVSKSYGVRVHSILHSGKKRARQTAEIFASALGPEKGVGERSGINPMDDVAVVAGALLNKENLMLVGHLPFMERLASYLITGSPGKRVIKFQNGGVVGKNGVTS